MYELMDVDAGMDMDMDMDLIHSFCKMYNDVPEWQLLSHNAKIWAQPTPAAISVSMKHPVQRKKRKRHWPRFSCWPDYWRFSNGFPWGFWQKKKPGNVRDHPKPSCLKNWDSRMLCTVPNSIYSNLLKDRIHFLDPIDLKYSTFTEMEKT